MVCEVGGCETCEIVVDAMRYSEMATSSSMLKFARAVRERACRAVINFSFSPGVRDGSRGLKLNQGILLSWGIWEGWFAISEADTESPTSSSSFSLGSFCVWESRNSSSAASLCIARFDICVMARQNDPDTLLCHSSKDNGESGFVGNIKGAFGSFPPSSGGFRKSIDSAVCDVSEGGIARCMSISGVRLLRIGSTREGSSVSHLVFCVQYLYQISRRREG